jgi:hypothetical protein
MPCCWPRYLPLCPKIFLLSVGPYTLFLSFLSSSWLVYTLLKKKIKFSSYIREFRMEQLQSHIWQRPPLIRGLIYEKNFIFFFISVSLLSLIFLPLGMCVCSPLLGLHVLGWITLRAAGDSDYDGYGTFSIHQNLYCGHPPPPPPPQGIIAILYIPKLYSG